MPTTLDLLDRYKKAREITSDNACAADLGITRATVSRWRNQLGHPEADTVSIMCERIGEPVARWLPLIEAERARTPEAKKVWLRLAQMAAAITLTIGVFAPHSAHAETVTTSRNQPTLYIMSNCRNARRRAGTLLATLRALFRTDARCNAV
jgi:hypothetical protein